MKKYIFLLVFVCLLLFNSSSADLLGIDFSPVTDWLSSIYDIFFNFVNIIVDVFSYIVSVIKTILFGLTTMLSSLFDLISQVFTSGLF